MPKGIGYGKAGKAKMARMKGKGPKEKRVPSPRGGKSALTPAPFLGTPSFGERRAMSRGRARG